MRKPPPRNDEQVIVHAERSEENPRHRLAQQTESTGQTETTWQIVAGCVDVVIYAVCILVWYVVIVKMFGLNGDDSSAIAPQTWSAVAAALTGWVVIAVLGEYLMLLKFDSTIGKQAVGLKVVDENAVVRLISAPQAAKRTLTKLAIFHGIGFWTPWVIDQMVIPGVFPWTFLALNAVLIPLMLGIHRQDRRGPHDLLSKTRVITL